MVKRFLESANNEEELINDVQEKKALPELILKQNILQAQDIMLVSERKLMYRYRLYKKFNRIEVAEFEGNIVLLFGFIKRMILEKLRKEDEDTYKLMLELENGKHFEVNKLLKLKNFLLKYLHEINITNLFQASGKGWETELENEY